MRSIGNTYEKLAIKHLKANRIKILERNVTFPGGEIDIIAKDNDELLFIEVKGRRNINHGQPSEFVDLKKQQRIIRCAEQYLQQHRLYDTACRFDVISIIDNTADKTNQLSTAVEWIKNAFTL